MARDATACTPETAFFSKTFDETVALLEESRTYVSYQAPIELRALTGLDRLRASRDMSRATTRLAEIMAWLLVQKAVHAGELSAAEAASEVWRLSRQPVCLDVPDDYDRPLPPRLAHLLDRTYSLYVRVARLDEMAAREAHA